MILCACFRRGDRLHCELASVGRVLAGRRPDDHVGKYQTAVRNTSHLPPDRHDFGRVQPDHLRMDEFKHTERAVPIVLHEHSEASAGQPVDGHGHDGRSEQDQTSDHVQHLQLYSRQSRGVFERGHRALKWNSRRNISHNNR